MLERMFLSRTDIHGCSYSVSAFKVAVVERMSTSNYLDKKTSSSKRCMSCDGCYRFTRQIDCRKCNSCLDLKKYGGKGKLHQVCKFRKCTNQKQKTRKTDKDERILVDTKQNSEATQQNSEATQQNSEATQQNSEATQQNSEASQQRSGSAISSKIVNTSRVRCLKCSGCIRFRKKKNCSKCSSCLDMKIYGGPGKWKAICRWRLCRNPSTESVKGNPNVVLQNRNLERELKRKRSNKCTPENCSQYPPCHTKKKSRGTGNPVPNCISEVLKIRMNVAPSPLHLSDNNPKRKKKRKNAAHLPLHPSNINRKIRKKGENALLPLLNSSDINPKTRKKRKNSTPPPSDTLEPTDRSSLKENEVTTSQSASTFNSIDQDTSNTCNQISRYQYSRKFHCASNSIEHEKACKTPKENLERCQSMRGSPVVPKKQKIETATSTSSCKVKCINLNYTKEQTLNHNRAARHSLFSLQSDGGSRHILHKEIRNDALRLKEEITKICMNTKSEGSSIDQQIESSYSLQSRRSNSLNSLEESPHISLQSERCNGNDILEQTTKSSIQLKSDNTYVLHNEIAKSCLQLKGNNTSDIHEGIANISSQSKRGNKLEETIDTSVHSEGCSSEDRTRAEFHEKSTESYLPNCAVETTNPSSLLAEGKGSHEPREKPVQLEESSCKTIFCRRSGSRNDYLSYVSQDPVKNSNTQENLWQRKGSFILGKEERQPKATNDSQDLREGVAYSSLQSRVGNNHHLHKEIINSSLQLEKNNHDLNDDMPNTFQAHKETIHNQHKEICNFPLQLGKNIHHTYTKNPNTLLQLGDNSPNLNKEIPNFPTFSEGENSSDLLQEISNAFMQAEFDIFNLPLRSSEENSDLHEGTPNFPLHLETGSDCELPDITPRGTYVDMLLTCFVCRMSCLRKYYKQHMLRHFIKKPFKCLLCKKRFCKKGIWKHHQLQHEYSSKLEMEEIEPTPTKLNHDVHSTTKMNHGMHSTTNYSSLKLDGQRRREVHENPLQFVIEISNEVPETVSQSLGESSYEIQTKTLCSKEGIIPEVHDNPVQSNERNNHEFLEKPMLSEERNIYDLHEETTCSSLQPESVSSHNVSEDTTYSCMQSEEVSNSNLHKEVNYSPLKIEVGSNHNLDKDITFSPVKIEVENSHDLYEDTIDSFHLEGKRSHNLQAYTNFSSVDNNTPSGENVLITCSLCGMSYFKGNYEQHKLNHLDTSKFFPIREQTFTECSLGHHQTQHESPSTSKRREGKPKAKTDTSYVRNLLKNYKGRGTLYTGNFSPDVFNKAEPYSSRELTKLCKMFWHFDPSWKMQSKHYEGPSATQEYDDVIQIIEPVKNPLTLTFNCSEACHSSEHAMSHEYELCVVNDWMSL